MAHADHVAVQSINLVSPVRAFFADILASFRNARQFRKTFEELDNLSSRELNDLGISKADITRIAYEAVYGEKTAR